MARKVPSRLAKHREVEAAEAKPASAKKTKATTAKKATTRKKTKAPERKRLIWGVFSGTMKEEARFPYDQRAGGRRAPGAAAVQGQEDVLHPADQGADHRGFDRGGCRRG